MLLTFEKSIRVGCFSFIRFAFSIVSDNGHFALFALCCFIHSYIFISLLVGSSCRCSYDMLAHSMRISVCVCIIYDRADNNESEYRNFLKRKKVVRKAFKMLFP